MIHIAIDIMTMCNPAKINLKELTVDYGGSIKSIAICLADNPSLEPAKKTLIDSLKRSNYVVVPARGFFENQWTDSVAIFNIPLFTLMHYCGLFKRALFVYSEMKDGKMINSFYVRTHESNDVYCLSETSDGFIDEFGFADDDGNFTAIGRNFSYSIKFDDVVNFNEKVIENYNSHRQRFTRTLKEEIEFIMTRGGMAPSVRKAWLYDSG